MAAILINNRAELFNAISSCKVYSQPNNMSEIENEKLTITKNYNNNQIMEELWSDLLGDKCHKRINDDFILEEGNIVELKNVTLSGWVPQFPGLYHTKYFWEHYEELKTKIKLIDFSFVEYKYQPIRFYSLIKTNKNFAHTDITIGLPVFTTKNDLEKSDDYKIIKENGALKLEKIKLMIEKIKLNDNKGQSNPIEDLKIRVLDYIVSRDQNIEPIQGNLGCLYYNHGKIYQINEHFWIGVPNYKDYLFKALHRLNDQIPKDSIILLKNECLNELILNNSSTFGPFFDQIKNIIKENDDLIWDNEANKKLYQEIVIYTKNRSLQKMEYIFANILSKIPYFNSNYLIDFRKPQYKENGHKIQTIFINLKKQKKPNLNFWGYLKIKTQ